MLYSTTFATGYSSFKHVPDGPGVNLDNAAFRSREENPELCFDFKATLLFFSVSEENRELTNDQY